MSTAMVIISILVLMVILLTLASITSKKLVGKRNKIKHIPGNLKNNLDNNK